MPLTLFADKMLPLVYFIERNEIVTELQQLLIVFAIFHLIRTIIA